MILLLLLLFTTTTIIIVLYIQFQRINIIMLLIFEMFYL